MSSEVVNLGNTAELPVLSIAEAVLAAAGRRVPIEYRPLPPDDPARRRPDIAKASQLLGWWPRVDLDEGLRHTLAFFRTEIAQLRPPAVAEEPPGSGG